ncbi:MAG: alpha/beta fold hydrolase [Candidatus Accumulibacter sp.]|uniref:Alpha/beta fold hydrolase n=1 Tax=Candidatus Accumulibacter affinis TaxID=2954384 RepID=A0A935TG27_9PROT|nr:alpha/beta fold hydrolase [Candidatus Accumulibacter affinis]
MKTRRIHTLHRPAVGPPRCPPLLFVHGGYATAGCWDEYFLPWFSGRGFDCHALDLAGHGGSESREQLHSYGLDDYAEDLAQVVQELDVAPILIGHSMSSVVVERFLERHQAHAAVLMAPVPPTGILGATMKIAMTTPAFFDQQARATRGEYTADALQTMRDVYYSADTRTADLIRFGPLFQPESRRALLDLTLLAMHIGRRRARLPALVVGGAADAVFPSAGLGFTAARWQAEVAVIPRAGHTLMLDAHWQAAAERILAWIEQQPQGTHAAMGA